MKMRRGFSMLELSLILGIIGAITGAIWTTVANVRESTNAGILYEQTLAITKNVRNYFSSRALPSTAADITTYSSASLESAKVFPEDMCSGSCILLSSTAEAKNIYGGTATIALKNSGATTPLPNQFIIRYTGLSKRGCRQLIFNLSAQAPAVGVITMKKDATSPAFPSFPVNVGNLPASYCNANGNTNTLEIYLKIRN